MRWPFEQYAKALLVSMPPEEALDRLLSVECLPQEDVHPGAQHSAYKRLASIRKHLLTSRPAGCYPGTVAEEMWLRVHKVAGYCLGERDAKAALALLDVPRTRFALEVLLIGGLPVPLICEQMNKVYGTSLTEEVVEHYAHYFWDRDSMGPEEWRAFLVAEVYQGNRSQLRDVYPNGRVLLQLLHSPVGVALWRAGITTTFDAESVLNGLINWGYTRFSETAIEPNTAGTAIKMERYAKIVLEAIDRRTDLGGAIQEQVKRAYAVATSTRKLDYGDARKLLMDSATAEEFMRQHAGPGRKEVLG